MVVVSTESKFGTSSRNRLCRCGPAAAQALVSVIIPTLNEAENLRHVLPTIPDVVDELVIVDGGSTDGTVDVVRELAPTPRSSWSRCAGKGNALRTGFAAASGDILVMMDADGSMDPLDIATFVAALNAGADVAKGSRFLQGGGSSDLTALRTFGQLHADPGGPDDFGGRYSDLCYGYMAFWRHVLPTFDGGADGLRGGDLPQRPRPCGRPARRRDRLLREPAHPRRQPSADLPGRLRAC